MRKMVATMSAFAMMLAMTVAAYANPTVTATAGMTGNGNNAELWIKVWEDGKVVESAEKLKWTNNSTKIYTVGEYGVEIVIKGNSVSSAKIVSGSATDDPVVSDPVTHRVNVSFHCNDIEGGGNGRVWTGAEGLQTLTLSDDKQANGNAIWTLNGPECECGRTDWVNFSNNSGVPNGNNIQLQHNGASRKWINVTVTYNVEIACGLEDFECKKDCKADKCENVCETKGLCDDCWCEYECTLEHGSCDCAEHKCIAHPTNCGKKASQRIVNLRELIRFIGSTAGPAFGFDFSHTAPAEWGDGVLVGTLTNPIAEILWNNKSYTFNYAGVANCTSCTWEAGGCEYVCTPCEAKGPCVFVCQLTCGCEKCDGVCTEQGVCDCVCVEESCPLTCGCKCDKTWCPTDGPACGCVCVPVCSLVCPNDVCQGCPGVCPSGDPCGCVCTCPPPKPILPPTLVRGTVGFHCDTHGGNGRSWTEFNESWMFEQIDGVWTLRNGPACEDCGKNVWKMYGGGTPGNNTQVNHTGPNNPKPASEELVDFTMALIQSLIIDAKFVAARFGAVAAPVADAPVVSAPVVSAPVAKPVVAKPVVAVVAKTFCDHCEGNAPAFQCGGAGCF